MQVLYLGRAPHTKETLPDFREKCRVTRHSRVFCGLTGSQRTPGFWGVTWGLSSLAEVLLEPGRQACNSWVLPFGHSILLSFCDSPQYTLRPAHTFLLGDPGLGEEPLGCVRRLRIQSLVTLIRPRQKLLLWCQRTKRIGSLKLLTCT